MKVLIVAKTRMRGGACVGAISAEGESLRLIPADIDLDAGFNLEYSIGDVWELVEYERPAETVPPHVENVIVHRKRKLGHWDDPSDKIENLMPPKTGGVNVLYGGMTQVTGSGSLYIAERTGVPAYSTMFWRPDRPLRLDDSDKHLHYCYPVDGRDRKLTFVGFQDPVPEIPAGTLVRVSLAHWWRPDDDESGEFRCYVQLSGWFPLQITPPPPPPLPPEPDIPDIEETLRSVFGFDHFREPQEEIIRGLLAGNDALVVMPTGGGKSLCYQLTAVARQGVTVVISPLISLMQDQVDALDALGIPATFLNSTLDYKTYKQRQQLVRQNKVRLLYLAPETLARPETINLLNKSCLTLLAIDEAHCISEWGPDFRPEYKQLGQFRRRLPAVPCIALTATATPRVQQDIMSTLGIDDASVFSGDLDRANLFLEVRRKSPDPVEQVVRFIQSHKDQSGIVYCRTRTQVDDLARELNEQGIPAAAYHAGLSKDLRTANQSRFVRDDINVMVATIAFGMGIDKSNIRFIIHYNLPDSLDKYYQQIGRSGRDGVRADCLLLYDPEDVRAIKYNISRDPPEERPGAYYRLEEIQKWAVSRGCRRRKLLRYFGQKYAKDNCGMCDRCAPELPYQADLDDLTQYAQMFLECVRQTEQTFGRTHIVDVLRGSKSQKVKRWRHDRLDVYGRGAELSKDAWLDLCNQFIDQGLVHVRAFRALKITDRGQEILDGGTFRGVAPPRRDSPQKARKTVDERQIEYDQVLFEKLRELRKSIADSANLPPYTIFHDSSLIEMAAYYPSTFGEFNNIRGVGDFKTSKYGEQFLAVIREHCSELNIQSPQTKYGQIPAM